MEEEQEERKTGFFFFFVSGTVPCCFFVPFFSQTPTRPNSCHQQTHMERNRLSFWEVHTHTELTDRDIFTDLDPLPWAYSANICKHSSAHSSCTCMDKQLYSTLMQTEGLGCVCPHPPQKSVIFFISGTLRRPPPSPMHLRNCSGVLRLPVTPIPSVCRGPVSVSSTYLPSTYWPLRLSLSHVHTETHVHKTHPDTLTSCRKMYFHIYCVTGGSLLRKHGAMQSSVTHDDSLW